MELNVQMNYWKMTMKCSFHSKEIGNHIMALLYPNLCYIEVCYKGAVLYLLD